VLSKSINGIYLHTGINLLFKLGSATQLMFGAIWEGKKFQEVIRLIIKTAFEQEGKWLNQ